MSETKIFNSLNKPTEKEKEEITDFLFESLEQYGDPKENILQAINYSLEEIKSFGGFVIASYNKENKIVGALVLNETGMSGYIPENILVYIATDKTLRGKGIGKALMDVMLDNAKGSIALHVEHNNPAKNLYEKYGFTNPYLEMRLKR